MRTEQRPKKPGVENSTRKEFFRRSFIHAWLGFFALWTNVFLCSASPVFANPPKIVFIGDSITAGHGVEATEAFSYLVGYAFGNVTIVNMASGGEDSEQSRTKMPAVWAENPYILVIEYALNDAVRSIPVATFGTNLSDWVRGAQYRGVKVILIATTGNSPLMPGANIQLRPYIEKTFEIGKINNVPVLDEYGRLAKEYIEGVLPSYLQPDGCHINNYGHALIAIDLVTKIRQEGWN